MKTSIIRMCVALIAFPFFSVFANDNPPGSIQGPSTGVAGTTAVYYVDDGIALGAPNCMFLGSSAPGWVTAYSEVGTRYEITVTWIGSGTATITFFNECTGTTYPSKSVTVSCGSTPTPDPVINLAGGSSCGVKILSYTETPPPGITWYWQTTPTGTNTGNATSSYTAITTGYYYVRAKANYCGGAWSTGYAITNNLVTVNTAPPAPPSPSVSSNTCGDKILTKNGSPGAGISWYWQGTNASGTDNTSPQATGTTYAASIYGTNTYYIRAFNPSSGCWSPSGGYYATVNTPPAPSNASFTACEADSPYLTTGNIYGTLRWYNDQNVLVNTGTSYTPAPMNNGTYTYTVKNYVATCEGPGAAVTLQVGNANCDNLLNWAQNKVYGINEDGSPKEIASSKTYTDGFGKVLQAQTKSYTSNQVFASHRIYDYHGEQTLVTLPAPINSSNFGYKHRFLTNSSGAVYSKNDFDLQTSSGAAGELNNPKPVANNGIGSLGWYYSTANNLEPAIATTSFPYSRIWSEKTPNPKNAKTADAGEAYRMGSAHETVTQQMSFKKSELSHYFSLQNHFSTLANTSETNLITNSKATTTYGYSSQGSVTLTNVTQSSQTYIKVEPFIGIGTSGAYPIEGAFTVVPGTTYKFRVKGYRSSSSQVYLMVKNVTANTNISWSSVALPQGSANENWVEASFTIPAGCTSIQVGVMWSSTPLSDSFFINDVMLYQTFTDANLVYGQKTLTIDADGIKSMQFYDNDGKSLATALVTGATGTFPNQVFTYDQWSYTYYNDMNQVVAEVAPNGVDLGSTAYPKFVSTYKYDHLGRLFESSTTDGGVSKFAYSKNGQIRFSQNQEQRDASPQRFSYTNYDTYERLIESGEYTMSGSGFFVFETHNTTTPAGNSVLNILDNVGHTGVTRRNNNASATRYNDTTFMEYDVQALDFPADSYHTYQQNVRGAVAKTKNANATSWNSYLESGKLEWTIQSINGLGTKTIDYVYNYFGTTTEVIYQKGQPDEFHHHFIYDADERLSEVWTSLNGTSKVMRAKYHYYLHGPLKRIEYGSNVQGLDFVYTINGALKTINNANPSLDPGSDGITNSFAPDVFGQTMHYFANDYSSTYNAGSQTFTGYQDRYNGLMKGVSWHTPVDNNSVSRSYAYTYDNKMRFTEAKFGNFTSGAFVPDAADAHKESVSSYDKNGNIQGMVRKGMTGNSLANYSYVYEPNTNRLDKVMQSSTVLVDYTYNSIGQLIQQTEGTDVMNISYNIFGKVKEIRNGSNQLRLSYFYNDLGTLSKRVDYNTSGTAVKNTFYVYDTSGNLIAVYEQTLPSGSVQLIELPVYAVGRIALFKPAVNTYFYEIADQLGSVRAVIGMPETDVYTATMESENAGTEEPPFKNIAATRVVSVAANHTVSGNEAVRLNNTKPAGPTISLAVSPGDLINLETWAYYEAGSSYNNTLASSTMIAAIASAFGGVSGAPGEAGQIFNSVNNALGAGGIGLGSTGDPNLPGAYISYMVFDVNKNFTGQGGYYRVTSSGNMAKELIAVPQITIDHPGYIYVCVYNRSDSPNWVYFDDLKVTQAHSPVVAGGDYYPYGSIMEGREVTQEDYRWMYQGQYAERDSVTNWNRFDMRMYDARIGRWLSVDPESQYASPYLGMGNLPNLGSDPTGGLFGMGPVASGAVIGAVVGTIVGAIVDDDFKDNWYYWTGGGAALGAIGGLIYKSMTYEMTGTGKRVGKDPRYNKPGGGGKAPTKKVEPQNMTIGRPKFKPVEPPKFDKVPYVLYSVLTYVGDGAQPNTGTLSWIDVYSDGSRQTSGTWDANSGSSSLQPTPEGEDWQVSNYRVRTNVAMVRDGVGFSLDITPDPRFGRFDLRIHPDGNVPGTAGCIGLTGGSDQLNNFANRIKTYLDNHPKMTLKVRGTYNPATNSGVNLPIGQ